MTYSCKLAKGVDFGLGIGGSSLLDKVQIEFMLFFKNLDVDITMVYENPCSCSKEEWVDFRSVITGDDLTKSKYLEFNDDMSIECKGESIIFASTKSEFTGSRMRIDRKTHGMEFVKLLDTIIDDESLNEKWRRSLNTIK